jgi:hypothetical protein
MDEHGSPGHEEAPRRIASGTDPRRLYVPLAFVLGAVLMAIIKPWGAPADQPVAVASGAPATHAPSTARPDRGTTAPVGPTGGSAAAADLSVTCGSPSGWRVATLQHWEGRPTPIRSWIAVDPIETTDPLDPAIPFAPVATDAVLAIGYCAPLDDARRPPEAAIASIWAILDGRAQAVTLERLEPAQDNALGELWMPAPEIAVTAASGDVWPPGRYVIEVAAPSGSFNRWMGVDIEDLRSVHAASPTVAPGPSGSGVASPGAVSTPGSTSPGESVPLESSPGATP